MGAKTQLLSLIVSGIVSALSWAYMTMLKVPSVLEVRPQLAEVGFWTGLMSGRGMEYLWLNHEGIMVGVTFVTWYLAINMAILNVRSH